jgi:hypothetical protein
MTNTEIPWFEKPDYVHRVASVLADHYVFEDISEVLYFFEKPWKWDDLGLIVLESDEVEDAADFFDKLYDWDRAIRNAE